MKQFIFKWIHHEKYNISLKSTNAFYSSWDRIKLYVHPVIFLIVWRRLFVFQILKSFKTRHFICIDQRVQPCAIFSKRIALQVEKTKPAFYIQCIQNISEVLTETFVPCLLMLIHHAALRKRKEFFEFKTFSLFFS